MLFFFFSSRRRHTRYWRDWSSDVCSSDLNEALGRSRGGFSTKIHVRAEGHGKPVTFHLTGGERHDSTALPALLDTGAIRRKRGRPRLRPRRVAGDKEIGRASCRERV